MFINCPYCRALVSTDPVTDLPPTHCPHCTSLLRRDDTVEDDDAAASAPMELGDLLQPHAIAAFEGGGPEDERIHRVDDTTITEAFTTEMTPLEHAPAETMDDATEQTAEIAIASSTVAAAASIAPARRGLRTAPSFARGSTVSNAPRERWVPAVAAGLALLLVLQLLLADRGRLAANPHWRPLLTVVCDVLACDLPAWREPAAFTLLQRDVRQHPGIPGALRVSATFRNDARWPQPWPQLRLSLSDVNGRTAGERSFSAEDYLGGPPSQAELASGESATVAMDITEPAARIVAYDFSFR
jgi:hypothetical protein